VHYSANIGSALNWPVGEWVVWEMVMKMNDVGSANGELHSWLNGVKAFQHTNVVWRNGTYNKGFQAWKWMPVWGGGPDERTRVDWWRVAHAYCSGIPFVP